MSLSLSQAQFILSFDNRKYIRTNTNILSRFYHHGNSVDVDQIHRYTINVKNTLKKRKKKKKDKKISVHHFHITFRRIALHSRKNALEITFDYSSAVRLVRTMIRSKGMNNVELAEKLNENENQIQRIKKIPVGTPRRRCCNVHVNDRSQ